MSAAEKQMGVGERIFLRKKARRTINMKARGQARVSKYKKDGTLVEHTPWVKNTIESEGFDKFLRMLVGDTNNHSALNATDATVGISATSAPGPAWKFKQEGTDYGPVDRTATKSAPAAAVMWEWHDDSTDVYLDANWLHFYYRDPEVTDNDSYRVAYVQIDAGTKPSDENWHYQFFLELYSTDTDFTSSGFSVLLDLYNGDRTQFLDTTGIRLHPTTGAGSGTEVGSALTPDADPTVNTTTDKITWVWTVADGVSNGVWGGTKVKIGTNFITNLRWGGCKTDGTSCGTKAGGEEWEYTYELSISQGS